MGAKLFTPNVGKNFGESFLATVDRERKLKQQQDQFNKDMAFKNRQLGLIDIYRTELLADQDAQEKRLQARFEFDKEQANKTKPFTGDRYENISTGVIGTEEFKGQKVNKIYDKLEQKEFQVPSFIDATKIDKDKTPKEPKLSDAGAEGLAYLKSPVFTKGSGKTTYELTNEEISNNFSGSINAVKKDILDSRTSSWFDTIVRQYGRMPTADELDREIVKHAGGEGFPATLTDADVGKLRRFVGYLEDAEGGIKKIEGRLKPQPPKDEDNGILGLNFLGL